MKLSRLLEQHDRSSQGGLDGAFGDGYLVSQNPVYRRIREAAMAEGYSYTSERDDAYETFPLLRLNQLLAKKSLPFAKNTAAFRDLTPRQTELLDWRDLEGNLKRNFVFHESCHAVVRRLAGPLLAPASAGGGLSEQRRFALQMIFEESCANACELFGGFEAKDPIHRIFYELNSYICEFERRTDFHQATERWGGPEVCRWMILSYLLSNFLRTQLDEGDVRRMQILSGLKELSSKDLKVLRSLSRVAFQLSERFREQTTAFHLRLSGVTTPITELFDFDVLSLFEREPGAETLLRQVSELLSSCRPQQKA